MYPNALKTYRNIDTQGRVADANPHKIIQMLLAGAIERIMKAKVAIKHNLVSQKAEAIQSAIAIVDGLSASLDHDSGAEVAENLRGLYEYMTRRLIEANVHNDTEILEEVISLLNELKSAWDAIPAILADTRRQNVQKSSFSLVG